ncbi:MAG: hypothetical protein RLZ98_1846 [Pseudomonadota bacterium]|jgi:tripartite-type tricarboxylate transporter receptor subunit TctC
MPHRPLLPALAAVLLGSTSAPATAEDVDLKGKTITMIVPSKPGGGTDASARLIARMIVPELPGKPSLLVRNVPGGGGVTALNYFVGQVARDGLTIAMASSTQADPINYRKPQSKYDPSKFHILGGVGRGGTLMIVRNDARPRLLDKSKPKVVVGSIGGVPRSGMQMAAWGIDLLDWNAKWVIGYRGTDDLMLALDRGEVEMTSTGNIFQINKLVSTGKFSVLTQSGQLQNGILSPRPEFRSAPLFNSLVEGRIKDPLAAKGYTYWKTLIEMDKWFALPPGSPSSFVATYRAAFDRATKRPEFLDQGRKISEDFEPMSAHAVETRIAALAETPKEAIDYISTMLSRQGLDTR